MTVSVGHLFQTPLVTDALPQAEAVNAALRSVAAREYAASPPGTGWSAAVPEGWWHDGAVGAALVGVRDHVVMLAERYTADVGSPTASRYLWDARLWAHAVGPGDRTEPVRSYDAFWMAVYIVDDGYGGSTDRGLGGEFVIADPRLPMPMAEVPDLRLRTTLDTAAPAYEPEIAIRPGSGRLLLYPGWLDVRRRPLTGGECSHWLTIALTAMRRRP